MTKTGLWRASLEECVRSSTVERDLIVDPFFRGGFGGEIQFDLFFVPVNFPAAGRGIAPDRVAVILAHNPGPISRAG
jgi:hypothetical protein